jgi:SAM-dependent methyltransferase
LSEDGLWLLNEKRESMTQRLYKDLAWVWPVLSPVGDYRSEGRALRKLLISRLGPERKKDELRLLDLGCGGGHLHSHLTGRFHVTGVDLSPAMLREARGLNPGGKYVKGDLRTVRFEDGFDAVMLHDAVSYMATAGDLVKALKSVKANLLPWGVGVVLPDYLQETFVPGEGAEAEGEVDGKRVRVLSRVEKGKRGRFVLSMTFVVEDLKTGKRKVIEDRHECGLFSIVQWLAAFEKAGLDVRVVQRAGGKWEPVGKRHGGMEAGAVGFLVQ